MFIHRFDSLPSTNVYADTLAREGAPHGTVITALEQTRGQGRDQRTFCSPQGGLYFSLIIRPELNIQKVPLVTLAAGVGVLQALCQISLIKGIMLKWPNDLYHNGLKLAGILTQAGPLTSSSGPEYCIIGVGINVNTDLSLFPHSLRPLVSSLYHITDRQFSIDEILQTNITCILEAITRLHSDKKKLLTEWRAADYLYGKELRCRLGKQIISALGSGLNDAGHYLVKDAKGCLHHIIAGDINPIQLPERN